jgi:polyisoprenoid-binding protein YceI
MRHAAIRLAALACAALALALPAAAAEQTLRLDPAATKIGFTLGATLHTADGSVSLASGEIRFDVESGAASGEIVIDAKSASTGLASRDRNMHADVLESEKHPRIVFRPQRLALLRRDAASADVELSGVLEMHGEEHPLVLPARVSFAGERVAIEAGFRVPYVDWGMADYSTLILRVDRYVDVTLASEGRLAAP